ncbi:hypothetical protein C1893_13155 [Pseudomonas sp. MPR-ANC1]|nr:hypothetical protein C1893_13155 [Pseudomonas sp. MPR-ANC1]
MRGFIPDGLRSDPKKAECDQSDALRRQVLGLLRSPSRINPLTTEAPLPQVQMRSGNNSELLIQSLFVQNFRGKWPGAATLRDILFCRPVP